MSSKRTKLIHSFSLWKNIFHKYPCWFLLFDFWEIGWLPQCPPFLSKFHLHHKPPTFLSKIPLLIYFFWGPFWGFHFLNFSSIQCFHRKKKEKVRNFSLLLSILSLFTPSLFLSLSYYYSSCFLWNLISFLNSSFL